MEAGRAARRGANPGLRAMEFIVRYWSSLLPEAPADRDRPPDAEPHWNDYSIHPASKLGLHNALLAVHDRLEILAAHGGSYDCAVFVAENGGSERLAPETADRLFAALPRGEGKWLDILHCLLPEPPRHAARPVPAPRATPAPRAQLPLFPHTHTLYDDLDVVEHRLDIEIG